ncbi:hypothetical protein K505DRAFT_34757 [Melanomma pulvis-pyrius CBS 109.77]|uniref:Uncharacterized protein n=1 Tax=Melanomma pulvis-pyrius CBS 109.77 TaxID=1314802 RepID=A0A6A6XBJ8_9PLEO|nr:hypothetical protein K505DRAFT_34757 [Melanomma pulvis-pyrius CBS 109.77]
MACAHLRPALSSLRACWHQTSSSSSSIQSTLVHPHSTRYIPEISRSKFTLHIYNYGHTRSIVFPPPPLSASRSQPPKIMSKYDILQPSM